MMSRLCRGKCNEYKQCPYFEVCECNRTDVSTMEDLDNERRMFLLGLGEYGEGCMRDNKSELEKVINSIDRDNFSRCMNPPVDMSLEKLIIANAGKIADCLRNGNNAEVHSAKDGIKVMEVRKKIVK